MADATNHDLARCRTCGAELYRFDFGVLEPAWGAFTFREVLS